MCTCMGGISGRHGRFSGLVTEGMSSIGPIMGLAGPRWAWAPAILALVGLVGLALWRDATGKGPACPGLECCTEKEKVRDGGEEDRRKEGREDNGRMEWRKKKKEKEGKEGGKTGRMRQVIHWVLSNILCSDNNMVAWSCIWVTTHAAQDTQMTK